MLCEYCNKEIGSDPLSKTGHYRACRSYRKIKNEIINNISKDFLIHEYIEKEKSVTVIANELGLKKSSSIIQKLKEYDIYIRTFKEGRKCKDFIERTKHTCNEKYGADYHTLKTSSIRKNIDAAVKLKYNVNNVFQVESVKKTIQKTCLKRFGAINPLCKGTDIFKKRDETVLNRYGVSNISKVDEFIRKGLDTKYLKSKTKIYTYSSEKADLLFSELLNNIEDKEKLYCAIKGKEFGIRIKETGRYYFYDFVDTKNKKCIEFNGNYWHANPTLYSPDVIIKKSRLTAKEIWEKDKLKNKAISDRGYDIKIIWESDFDENPERILEECISFLK